MFCSRLLHKLLSSGLGGWGNNVEKKTTDENYMRFLLSKRGVHV